MTDILPEFYQHWLGNGVDGEWAVPRTKDGDVDSPDCANCAMVAPRGRTRDLGPFRTDLKCCTYHPFLPNFTLGRLFIEVNEGRLSNEILQRYLRESRITPIGAFSKRPPTSVCETGKIPETKCPFLSGENAVCGIRDFRPSPCAGYVCRSSLGDAGLKKWKTWESLIAKFEWSLAHDVAFELGYTLDDVNSEWSFEDEKATEQAYVFYSMAYEKARLTSVSDQAE